MIKTYKTINVYNLITTVFADGRECIVEFTGGHSKPYAKAGSFTTADAGLQKAIESDIGYGISFILAESYGEEYSRERSGTVPQKRKKENKKIVGIRTRQMAIEYLENITGKKISKNTGRATVVETAADLGIEFPELN